MGDVSFMVANAPTGTRRQGRLAPSSSTCSHPDSDRRLRSFTGSAHRLLDGFAGSTAGRDFHPTPQALCYSTERTGDALLRLSAEPVRLGEVGSAMAAKLALNQLIASLSHAFSLSLHLVQRSGVEVEAFMALLRNSALYAPTFDKKLERELTGDYSNPNFPTAHLRKDLALFEKAAQASGLETMGLEGLLSLLQKAMPAGLDPLDYCALHALTAGRTAAAEQP